METREDRIRRLAYRAGRRGFKEADLVIGGFARARLSEMSPADLDDFEALLEAPDPDLYAWAMGTAQPPARLDRPVLAALRAFVREGGAVQAD